MDGYADAIESALNLYNREYTGSTETYMEKSIRRMWDLQQPDGIIEGWHGDGNFARTSIMYGLWKTQGLTIRNWSEDVIFGAVQAYNYDSPLPSDLVLFSSNSYEAVKNGTCNGAMIYTDRIYTLTQIPDYLKAETIIRTACNDKNLSNEELISFTAPADITVYLAIDKRVTAVPDWMKDWTLTVDELDTSLEDLEFSLYRKSFTKGTKIHLGGPQAAGFQGYTASGNYLVFVMENNPPVNRPPKSKNTLKVSMRASSDWEGKLIFDNPRHRIFMNLPFNWARINQFPEWYTVEPDSTYIVFDLTMNHFKSFKGLELMEGIDIVLKKDQEQYFTIMPESDSNLITHVNHPADGSPGQHGYDPLYPGVYFSGNCLVIDGQEPAGIHTVNIYNMQGSLLYHQAIRGSTRIGFPAGSSNGILIVQVIADQKVYSGKIALIH
jgi:hypothetical protein